MPPARTCAKCEQRPATNLRGLARCEHCRYDPDRDGIYKGPTKARRNPPAPYYEPDEMGMLAVACWCEEGLVHVPAVEVGRTTRTCGRPTCREALAA